MSLLVRVGTAAPENLLRVPMILWPTKADEPLASSNDHVGTGALARPSRA
jgi:hypothetical protein